MYSVYFQKSFFDGLDSFLISMKSYYKYFYSNTGIEDEDKIVKGYFDLYDSLKENILNEINEYSKNGILGRKIFYDDGKIENCSFSFFIKNYKVTFSAI